MSKNFKPLIYGMMFLVFLVGSQAFGSLITGMYLSTPEKDPISVSSDEGFTFKWRFNESKPNRFDLLAYGPNSRYSDNYDSSAGLDAWYCSFVLVAPNGDPLGEGVYEDAVQWPGGSKTNPQIALWESYLSADDIAGKFEIFELALDGEDIRFSVDFSLDESTHGSIRISSEMPPTLVSGATVPVPATVYLLLTGLMIALLCVKGDNIFEA
ncbi:MAG: hypothetical protein GY804_06945 [Alphaproteobacteria bacterium]|nr:hypothetical protein [Alphaproteobacteria bacterium]